MQRMFDNYLDGRRPITVKVTREYITFHFKNEGDREFYWLGTDDWINDSKNRPNDPSAWPRHMLKKSWFSEEMKEFIDESIKLL